MFKISVAALDQRRLWQHSTVGLDSRRLFPDASCGRTSVSDGSWNKISSARFHFQIDVVQLLRIYSYDAIGR